MNCFGFSGHKYFNNIHGITQCSPCKFLGEQRHGHVDQFLHFKLFYIFVYFMRRAVWGFYSVLRCVNKFSPFKDFVVFSNCIFEVKLLFLDCG